MSINRSGCWGIGKGGSGRRDVVGNSLVTGVDSGQKLEVLTQSTWRVFSKVFGRRVLNEVIKQAKQYGLNSEGPLEEAAARFRFS